MEDGGRQHAMRLRFLKPSSVIRKSLVMHSKGIRDEHTIVYFFKISKGACCGLLLFERNQTRTLLYVVTATSLPPSELKLIIFKKSLESGSSGVKQSCRAKL